MFSGCILLKNLPDISNWDTSNVVDMSKMFMCLKHIISFPDISKWKIQKVTDAAACRDNQDSDRLHQQAHRQSVQRRADGTQL